MSEWQKMISGEIFENSDPEIRAASSRAKNICRLYNNTLDHEISYRNTLLLQLLGSAGEGSYAEPPFHCDYGVNVRAGKNFYCNYGCVILDNAPISMGDNVWLGPQAKLITVVHPLDAKERAPFFVEGIKHYKMYAKAITIGSDVWIGAGAVICPGVTIGSGTVIGANSVVTKDLPSGVFAGGVPAKVIKTLHK